MAENEKKLLHLIGHKYIINNVNTINAVNRKEKKQKMQQIIEKLGVFNADGIRHIQGMLDIFANNAEWLKATTPEELEAIKAQELEEKKEREETDRQRKAYFAYIEERFEMLQRETFGKRDSVKVVTWEFELINRAWLPKFIIWHPDKVEAIIEVLYEAGYKAGVKFERNKHKKKATTQNRPK